MKASQFFKVSPLYDEIEVIRAVESTCARCGQMDGHSSDCVELFLQAVLRELINTKPERENGGLL